MTTNTQVAMIVSADFYDWNGKRINRNSLEIDKIVFTLDNGKRVSVTQDEIWSMRIRGDQDENNTTMIAGFEYNYGEHTLVYPWNETAMNMGVWDRMTEDALYDDRMWEGKVVFDEDDNLTPYGEEVFEQEMDADFDEIYSQDTQELEGTFVLTTEKYGKVLALLDIGFDLCGN